MANQTVLTAIGHLVSKEQMLSWATQHKESERSVQWLVKSLLPTLCQLWYRKTCLSGSPAIDGGFNAAQIQEQLNQIWRQKSALTPALAAFSGIQTQTVQDLAPRVTDSLALFMASFPQEELFLMLQQERHQLELLVPQLVRQVVPELQAAPILARKEDARQSLLHWLMGLLVLVLIAGVVFWVMR